MTRPAAQQDQFLDVIDRDEAQRRFHEAVRLDPLEIEQVLLPETLGRVLAADVVAEVDVPSFDRSNFDGFAVRAADTYGSTEESPRTLELLEEVIATAVVPRTEVSPGKAVCIATGGMLPRGADAVLMVEYADDDGAQVIVRRAVTPGKGVTFAGTDIAAGETVLRRGQTLTSRETGVLAAIGANRLAVWRRPRVGIISTGDEIIEPGTSMQPGRIYDSNARIIADAVRELGAEPVELGIVADCIELLRVRVRKAIDTCDIVLLSGGTSKGVGDLCYHVVAEFDNPGIVAHGVALKPGKPICLAATEGKALVVLPGFPTSAIFTFHEFVSPVIARLAGRPPHQYGKNRARMAVRINSEIGRTEYLLVGLVEPVATPDSIDTTTPRLVAYPMGKGSGSVTTFSRADGFVTIDRQQEIVEQDAAVTVQLLGRDLSLADLVVIGSHCVGLDTLLGKLQQLGFTSKFLAVGSTAGLEAARRGECDLAGIHLLDPETGKYNHPFVNDDLELIRGYGRMQGVLFRPGDPRFRGSRDAQVISRIATDPTCVMVNRNRGSGTRILIDRLLGGAEPNGYAVQARNHNAVAAAVAQGRADWGVAIRGVAEQAQLGFLELTKEQFDFIVPTSRRTRPGVEAFCQLLAQLDVRQDLIARGFVLDPE